MYELDERTYNDYLAMSLRVKDLTGDDIDEDQAKELIKRIRKTTTISEQETIIINYLA